MTMQRRRPIRPFIGYLLVLLLVVTAIVFAQRRMQAQTTLDDVVPAVVRIVAINCNIGCVPQAVGSGVIIHPSGIILTAWHVVVEDENNPHSLPHTDFLIEVTDRARNPVQTRYRAQVIALAPAPDVDLALLRIYRDEERGIAIDSGSNLALPVLPLGENDRVSLGTPLQILGYPLVARDTIDYTTTQVGGFEERLIRVRETLSPGNSGGPVLAEQNGRLAVVGVVIRNRGKSGELALLREIESLDRLIWIQDEKQGWLSDVAIESNEEQLRVQGAVHTVGVKSDSVSLLAYLFDARTGAAVQTVTDARTNHIRTRSGQIVLAHDVPVDGFITESGLTLSVDLNQLDATPDDLRVHLVLWDGKTGRALWQSERPLSVSQSVAIAPPATATPVPPATNTPTPSPTSTNTLMPTATPTATDAPNFTPTPNATATATPTSTATSTPAQLPTSTNTVASADTPTETLPGTDAPILTPTRFITSTPLPRPTPSSTPTPRPTATPNLHTPTVTVQTYSYEIAAPPDGELFIGSRATFEWNTNFPLQAGQYLELIFWPKTHGIEGWPGGRSPIGAKLWSSTAPIWIESVDLDWFRLQQPAFFTPREYYWGVAVVVLEPEYRKLALLGPGVRFFTYEPSTATPRPSATPTETPLTTTPTSTPTPSEPEAGATRIVEGITFVYVPAGEFQMGSNEFGGEQPVQTMYLDGYWIGQTEVTNAQFRVFMEAGGYTTERYWREEGWVWRVENQITEPEWWQNSNFNGDQQPVNAISWYEADAYSRWLAETAGLSIRLPTEAEWEKAARGPEGRIYPWGDAWDPSRVNYCDKRCGETFRWATWADTENDDGFAYTSPVGSYPNGASPYGALDMAGNVWEWTGDSYAPDYYATSPDRNPTGPDDGSVRVLRGGSWATYPTYLRGAGRNGVTPVVRDNGVGVRVVLAPGF